jgi:hypothetical protein
MWTAQQNVSERIVVAATPESPLRDTKEATQASRLHCWRLGVHQNLQSRLSGLEGGSLRLLTPVDADVRGAHRQFTSVDVGHHFRA